MASPKNWEKIGEDVKIDSRTKAEYAWKNSGWKVWVEKRYDQYMVYKRAPNTHANGRIASRVSNKQDARKKAVKWMEKHPNP